MLYILRGLKILVCVQLSAVCKTIGSLTRENNIEHRPRLLAVASESNCLCELDLLTGNLGRTNAVRPRYKGRKRQKARYLDEWATCVAMHEGHIHICQYKACCLSCSSSCPAMSPLMLNKQL